MTIEKALKFSAQFIVIIVIATYADIYTNHLLVAFTAVPFGQLGFVAFGPLYHLDTEHLMSNLKVVVPLLFIISIIDPKNVKISVVSTWVVSGVVAALMRPDGAGIGLSGVTFGLYSFTVIRSLFVKKHRLFALMCSIGILYMWAMPVYYGIQPSQDDFISWQAHLGGFGMGIVLGVIA